MSNRIHELGQSALDIAQDAARQVMSNHEDAVFQKGFTSSARITLNLIDQRIESYRAQMRGAGLSRAEQSAYAVLVALRSEITDRFDGYWDGTGIDWRPREALAKASLGTAEQLKVEEATPSGNPSTATAS